MVRRVLMTPFSVSKLPGPSEEISDPKWKCVVASKCLAVTITIAFTQLEKYSGESSVSRVDGRLKRLPCILVICETCRPSVSVVFKSKSAVGYCQKSEGGL